MDSCLLAPVDPAAPPDPTLRLSPGRPQVVDWSALAAARPHVTIAGDYELLDLLGRGGTGVVYRARHRRLKRHVAYKVLTTLGDVDPDALTRFRAEAETLARLHHPGIVQVFDAGVTHGTPFIAMEYVPGGCLAGRLKARRPTPREAAALITTVAGAVGYAHTQGVVHRDLKPANILLDAEGRPKVADFGIARDLAGETHGGDAPSSTVVGTPRYMPPEQFSPGGQLTPAVDVWALGVILYELLTGASPFPGTDPQQVLANVLRHDPVRPREWQPKLPYDLETICLKCLQPEAHRRYPSGKDLAEDLQRFLDNHSISARPVGPVERGVRWCRRNPVVAALATATVVTLAAGSAVSLALAARAVHERANAVAAVEAERQLRRQAEAATAQEQKARREAEAITAMLDALLAKIHAGQDIVAGLREEMDRTAGALRADVGDPLIRARLLYTLAIARRKLGDFQAAVPLMERSLALRTEHLGADHPLTRQTAGEMAYTYVHVGRGADAVRLVEPVVTATLADRPADAPEAVEALRLLRIAYEAAGRGDDADAVGERVLAVCVRRYGPDHEETEWERIHLRRYSVGARRFDEAIPVLKKAYARFKATWGPESIPFVCARAELGRCLLESGRPEQALPYLKEMVEASVTRAGPTHPHTLIDRNDLARCYEACGRFAEAADQRRQLRDQFRKAGDTRQADRQAEQLARDVIAAGAQAQLRPQGASLTESPATAANR